ncbi:MAG: Fe-S cluster assembly sulfur transfer protein SufU [Pyramidobacter sp.]|jgi:nitrogen fixation NifU-like protein
MNDNRTFYNDVLTEHNIRPEHKHPLHDANFSLEGVNPSCGDDIVLNLKVENGVVADGSFEGDGCAISQASADIMLDLVIGRSKEDALRLSDLFLRMIQGKASEEEIEELEEAGALRDVSHMPARVKCAVLGWHTMEEIFRSPEKAAKK